MHYLRQSGGARPLRHGMDAAQACYRVHETAQQNRVGLFGKHFYLCWPLASSVGQTAPHDGQACLTHTASMILNGDRVARDMRSQHTACQSVVNARGTLRHQPKMMHKYAPLWIGRHHSEADSSRFVMPAMRWHHETLLVIKIMA